MMRTTPFAVLFVILAPCVMQANGQKITYACGPTYDKRITIYLANEPASKTLYTVMETGMYGTNNIDVCRTEGTGTPESILSLHIKEVNFDGCGVKITDEGKKGCVYIIAHTNRNIMTALNSEAYEICCNFSVTRTQTVIFGANTFITCKAGEFYCTHNGNCMSGNVRCAGDANLVNRCTNSNGQETGCNANSNGTYNIEQYSTNGTIQWMEYRGFGYFVNNLLATEEDSSHPTKKEKYDLVRTLYIRQGSSTCPYNAPGEYNAWFNGKTDKEREQCFNYHRGLKQMLIDSCQEFNQVSDDANTRSTYFDRIAAVPDTDSECSRAITCGYTRFTFVMVLVTYILRSL